MVCVVWQEHQGLGFLVVEVVDRFSLCPPLCWRQIDLCGHLLLLRNYVPFSRFSRLREHHKHVYGVECFGSFTSVQFYMNPINGLKTI